MCLTYASRTKVLVILWGLSLCISEYGIANQSTPVVGVVSEVRGAPDVLRDPSKVLTDTMKVKEKSDGYRTVLYQDTYWKAFPVIAGLKIHYGDVLSSGPDSKMVLSLQDGFRVILAKNTKVRITPNFMKGHLEATMGTWLNLLSGKIRAYLLDHDEEPQTQFRTRTIAMGVRGTEFMLSVDQGHTKLLTIDGEIFARPIKTLENELFDLASEAFAQHDGSQLSQRIKQLNSLDISDVLILKQGQKVERVELPPPETMDKLDPPTKAALWAKQKEFTSLPAQVIDLEEAKEIGSNIQQLNQDQRLEQLESLSAEPSTLPPEKSSDLSAPPDRKPFLARVGFDNLSIHHEDIDASSGGLSISLDYLPSPYYFFSLGLSSGSWELKKIQTRFGRGPDDFEILTKDYSYYLVSVGGRWPYNEAFSAALALSYAASRQLALQDKNLVKLDYHMSSSVLFRFELSYQIWENWQIFLSLGGGSSQAKVRSEDLINSKGFNEYALDVDEGYARLGIGRQFDLP